MMATDDPDHLGWDAIDHYLERDGTFGFRLLPADSLASVRDRLAARDYRLDTWDVFAADRTTALAACEPRATIPPGFTVLPQPTADMLPVQRLMYESGIVPFSAALLAGAVTVALADSSGDLAAAAHGYLPHNAHSPFAGWAWGGLVAVAEQHRGRGLGTFVNALMIAETFRRLPATHIYELVSATNAPSRRMVAACGLTPALHLACGVATPSDASRFTH